MTADYYVADTENGDHIDDPSEDALFMLISDLNSTDNTFVVIQPDTDDPVWFATVGLLSPGQYETVLRDKHRREHELQISDSISEIAKDLTIWLASRFRPNQP